MSEAAASCLKRFTLILFSSCRQEAQRAQTLPSSQGNVKTAEASYIIDTLCSDRTHKTSKYRVWLFVCFFLFVSSLWEIWRWAVSSEQVSLYQVTRCTAPTPTGLAAGRTAITCPNIMEMWFKVAITGARSSRGAVTLQLLLTALPPHAPPTPPRFHIQDGRT